MRKIYRISLIFMLCIFTFCIFAKGAEEVETSMSDDGPQYGGTISAFVMSTENDPGSPDIKSGSFSSTEYLAPIQERLLYGDFETYGPRGTGVYPFQVFQIVPKQYLKGHLLEDWEVTEEKVILHVRPGIYWAPNEEQSKWMEKREFVADDIVSDIEHFMTVSRGENVRKAVKDVYAEDKYTVVINFANFSTQLMYLIGYEDRSLIAPPETLAQGDDQWENQVGTGPFMLGEYNRGSFMRYLKNPDWWKTTIIDGEEYSLPFIDELIYPIIPDVSTQVAALRTGKLDVMQRVPPDFVSNLQETTPDLNIAITSGSQGWGLAYNTENPPFDNAKVRQALSIGTNYEEFSKLWDIDVGEIHYPWWPLYQDFPNLYIPKDKLPLEVSKLYNYDPDTAKKMLEQEGIPEGFTITVVTDSSSRNIDRAALLKDQWEKIGVNLEIDSYDNVSFSKIRSNKSYNDAIMTIFGAANAEDELINRGFSESWANWAQWKNEEFDGYIEKIQHETDFSTREKLLQEAALIIMREIPYMPLEGIPEAVAWWPWVKNFYGEKCVGDNEIAQVLAHAWVDVELKKSMGY